MTLSSPFKISQIDVKNHHDATLFSPFKILNKIKKIKKKKRFSSDLWQQFIAYGGITSLRSHRLASSNTWDVVAFILSLWSVWIKQRQRKNQIYSRRFNNHKSCALSFFSLTSNSIAKNVLLLKGGGGGGWRIKMLIYKKMAKSWLFSNQTIRHWLLIN